MANESPHAAPNKLPARKFSRIDAGRIAIVLLFLAVTFPAWYFLLAWIQSAILPNAPGGQRGPWLIRPIVAFHIVAAAFSSALSVPLLGLCFRSRWKAQDEAVGTRYDPYRHRRARKALLIVQGCVLLLIYGAALFFYLFSWTIVGPHGIEVQFPWGRHSHSFSEITSLQMIPREMRSDDLAKNGPWYQIEFVEGRGVTFDSDDEGSSDSEQSAMAAFIANQCGRPWRFYPDVHRR